MSLDLEQALEHYYAAGGTMPYFGAHQDAHTYWRQAAKLWREKAEALAAPRPVGSLHGERNERAGTLRGNLKDDTEDRPCARCGQPMSQHVDRRD